jgi:hypothetical protein
VIFVDRCFCQNFAQNKKLRTSYQIMAWDAKRQLIWLAGGLTLGTLIAYQDAHDDDGTFVPRFFIFMESLVLIIIGLLFYIYSRRKG